MVVCKILDIRWLWRYKFYLIVLAIMSVQIFFAVIFFTLYEETDRNSDEIHVSHIAIEPIQPKLNGDTEVDIHRINRKFVYHHNEVGNPSNVNVKPAVSDTFTLSVGCNISGRESISAINRARTSYCKQLIVNTTCRMQNNELYPTDLPHSCPSNGLVRGRYLGCYRDNNIKSNNGVNYNATSRKQCLNKCLRAGFSYAGVHSSDKCLCSNQEPSKASQLPETSCDLKCPMDLSETCGGYHSTNVMETGVAKFVAQTANDAFSYRDTNSNPVRIVFLLTLNGRDIRQVYRLIKVLFHRDHFFFIHVDARQDYLFRELLPLELKLSNLRLSRRRHSSIWGGASLLTMLLESMTELIQSSWDWDFLINLSESDFPIKTNNELVAFLSANRNRNFVKSHRRDVYHFIHKQGLDRTFVECDEHMWRIGDKILPSGIVIDGGSDWITLSRPFINYVVTAQNDALLDGLKVVFKHTLLPAESFFHTVLRNSIFCDTYVDNNLRVTNWKRHLGCKCQYKHVVDWCGCSPNVFTMDDWSRIQSTVNKSLFFARKFDPTVSQLIINRVEELLYGRYTDEFSSERKYWHNMYHHLDRSPTADKALLTVCSSLSRHTLNYLANNDLMCLSIDDNKLLQVFSFYDRDVHRGIIIHFEGISTYNISTEYEVRYEIKYSFTLYNVSKISTRFVNLQINTHFDAKEKMSRNYAGVIGSYSEPVLIYQLVMGAAVSNVTVLWLDPTQSLVDVSEISLDEAPGVYHSKPNLKNPLASGEWEVYLVHDAHVLARVDFVVVPLNQELTTAQAETEYSKVSTDWNALLPVIKLKKDAFDPIKRREKSLINWSLRGDQQIAWIDSLTKKYYTMVDYCVVHGPSATQVKSQCYQSRSRYCDHRLWSSFSSDPKIHISTVNKSTGRLN